MGEKHVGSTPLLNPLEGLLDNCVLEDARTRPGFYRLVACPPGRERDLAQIPGVQYLRNVRPGEAQGWYVPRNVVEAGRYPHRIGQWQLPSTRDRESIAGSIRSSIRPSEHQLRAMSFLLSIGPEREGGILAGDPGLGKTLIALCAAHEIVGEAGPVLVCGPLAARQVWVGEQADALLHLGIRVQALETNDYQKYLAEHRIPSEPRGWYFIHYNVLESWAPWVFGYLKPTIVIFDEIHLLSNPDTTFWRSSRRVSRGGHVKLRFGLTGTPIPKTRMDLAAQLLIVQPSQWSTNYRDSVHEFGVRYAGGHREALTFSEDGEEDHRDRDRDRDRGNLQSLDSSGDDATRMVWIFEGQTHTDELVARLAGGYLRFTKEEVDLELPDLCRHVVELSRESLDLADYYRAMSGENLPARKSTGGTTLIDPQTGAQITQQGTLEKKPDAAQLVQLTQLVSALDHAKEKPALDLVLSLTETFQHIVLLTWRIDAADALHAGLSVQVPAGWKVFGPVNGTQAWRGPGKKEAEARRYAEAEKSIFVGTRDSCGVAINDLRLTQALVLTSLHWNPANNIQIEGRGHRQGNPFQEFHVYLLVARGTVDDKFLEKLQRKAEEAHALSEADVEGITFAQALLEGDERGHAEGLELTLQLLRGLEL
ncbi:MAG: DEAD/DEAH box helicase [Deltaproteobacteria bacterium]|nr:DEAD/DEAH box helicase [Deltaproteobacteria bacterium]